MQISRLFWAHPVDTEKWQCQEHFEAHIDVWGDLFSVKQTGKSHRDSSLVNKVDLGAVQQFQFPENPEPDYTCVHLHCHE